MALRKYFAGLSVNTFLLALASLFADISTEMLYPILPVFLTAVHGAPVAVVGIAEGAADGATALAKVAAGIRVSALTVPLSCCS